jgi:A/G-specific adenine glycosylase
MTIVDNYQAAVPETAEEIRKLPGVGDYIAAAVLSIAFNQPLAVVDGNVKRVLSRLFTMDMPVNHSGSHADFKKKAEAVLDRTNPAVYNQALMELGALVCKPGQPDCPGCPLSPHCQAFKHNRVEDFPRKKKARPLPEHALAAGVVVKKGKLLLTLRPENGLLGGLWEFPNGKIDDRETPDVACLRHVKESANVTAEIDTFVTRIKHAYTHFRITMDVFACRFISGRVHLNGPADFRWVGFDEIKNYPLPKAVHKFLPDLTNVLKP